MKLDVSDCIRVKGDAFTLTEKIAPGKEVKFTTVWRDKEWFFEGIVSKDGKKVNLMLLMSK
tara:strand:+ start:3048 stop:3230 length:183 start_codon:yes stop_codon:yes gene_type:complete